LLFKKWNPTTTTIMKKNSSSCAEVHGNVHLMNRQTMVMVIGQPTASGGEGQQKQHQQPENFNKKNCGGQQENYALEVCTSGLK
jgi:hypothetical protein